MRLSLFSGMYRELYDPVMTEAGFQRKGNVYYRQIEEQIVILFTFYKFCCGREFTMAFDIFRLCDDVVFDRDAMLDPSYRYSEVIPELRGMEWSTHEYPINLPQSLQYTREEILPLLNRITGYESCLEVLFELEKKESGRAFSAAAERRIRINCIDAFFAVGKYDLALDTLWDYVQEWEEYCRKFREERGFPHIREENLRIEKQYYEEMKQFADSGDFEAIRRRIREKELRSLASFRNDFLKIKN